MNRLLGLIVFLAGVAICALPGQLRAEEDTPRALSPDDLRCQMLLQDYLGKTVQVTGQDGKKVKGLLVSVDRQNLTLKVKSAMRVIPVPGIRKIELLRSVSDEITKGVGGAIMGIGIIVGGLFMIYWLVGSS
ncbi:hypothetical protein LLH00_17650 [bacterium]|nr:hypothetical protein [bacterium]